MRQDIAFSVMLIALALNPMTPDLLKEDTMARWGTWKRYTRTVIDRLPNNRRGAYQIANRNMTIVDIGGSDREYSSGVKERLINRLINNKCPSGYFFRCQYADLFDSGLDMEGKTTRRIITKTGKRPKYNKRTPRTNNSPFW